jgi:hypothetical protein
LNLHTPRDVSLASNEVRCHSAHPTDTFGGDDPIRTDGAFQRHSALAVRRLRPLGHVSMNSWWGWRDLNSHARRRWFLRPVCLPFPPHPHHLLTSRSLDTLPTIRFVRASRSTKHGGLPGSRTLNMSQLLTLPRLPIPPEAQKAKAPRISRGFCGCLELCLNQPHPSTPSKSLRLSERYELNRFFTKTRIPQFYIKSN